MKDFNRLLHAEEPQIGVTPLETPPAAAPRDEGATQPFFNNRLVAEAKAERRTAG